MKKINIYYLFDILLTLATVFFLLSRIDIFLLGSMALYLITWTLVLLESIEKTQLTQTVVTNDSDEIVLYKPKHESALKEMAPHTSVEGVESIKVAGKVFKTSKGTHVVIARDNRISTKAITGKIANIIRGGFIKSAPDAGWNMLFEKN